MAAASEVNVGEARGFAPKSFRIVKGSLFAAPKERKIKSANAISCRGCAGPLGASPENNPQIELPRRAKRTTGQFMIEDVFRGSPKGTGESNEAGRYRYSI